MSSQFLHEWQNFYLLVGTAAATLVGLMFVAISLGARSITPRHIPALRVFVSPTLIHFVYVLLTASVVIIPTVTRTTLGGLLVLVGLISAGRSVGALAFMRQQYREQVVDVHDWIWYLVAPTISYVLFIGAGIGLLLGAAQSLNALALANILLLIAGIRNAWDYVTWMVLREADPSTEADP